MAGGMNKKPGRGRDKAPKKVKKKGY